MTLFHAIHHPLSRTTSAPRRSFRAPAWVGQIAWFRLGALGLNLALWAGIILGVRAMLRL